jgi:ribulose-5-phosphate 4-epimerase/fuculose-1-phosphate aldolase
MARDNAKCVMPSHITAGMAVAAQKQGLLPLNQMSMQFFDRTSYHDYSISTSASGWCAISATTTP